MLLAEHHGLGWCVGTPLPGGPRVWRDRPALFLLQDPLPWLALGLRPPLPPRPAGPVLVSGQVLVSLGVLGVLLTRESPLGESQRLCWEEHCPGPSGHGAPKATPGDAQSPVLAPVLSGGIRGMWLSQAGSSPPPPGLSCTNMTQKQVTALGRLSNVTGAHLPLLGCCARGLGASPASEPLPSPPPLQEPPSLGMCRARGCSPLPQPCTLYPPMRWSGLNSLPFFSQRRVGLGVPLDGHLNFTVLAAGTAWSFFSIFSG